MTKRMVEAELARLARAVEADELEQAAALESAFALGVEWERLEAMHKACAQYSEAKAESERRRSNPPGKP